jgi:cobalt-zinc-cadmium efflux system outer membrane protein
MKIYSVCRMFTIMAGCAAGSLGHAAPAPLYPELLRRSLPNAPALLEAAADVGAARGEARQARAWRNPTADAVFENLGTSRDPNGATQRQTTYTVTEPIEIGGKRSARIAAGDRSVEAAEARDHEARIHFAADLAIAYATAEAAQEHLLLAADDLGRAKEDLRAASALVQAGKEAALRRAQALAAVAAASATQEAASADVTEALARLSVLAGVKDDFTSVGPSLLEAVSTPRADVGPNLGAAPVVQVANAEQRALAAQVRIAEKQPIPDIGLSAGLRRYQGLGTSGLVVGVSATIPLFDRNHGAIEAAKERARAAEARLASARLQAEAERRITLARLTAVEHQMQAASDGERSAAEAYRLGRIGYDAGRTPLLELLLIRRGLSEARDLLIESRLGRVRVLAALSEADGQIAFGD